MAFKQPQRYDPISTLMSFQHKKNHYKHLINPRKSQISFWTIQQQQNNNRHFSILQSKYQKNMKEERKKRNKQIYKEIQTIFLKKKGILQKAEEQFKNYQKQQKIKPRRSLINPIKAKAEEERIHKENISLIKKINNLRPLVCQKNEWKKHQKFSQQMKSKLKSKSLIVQQRLMDQNIMKLVIQNQRNKTNDIALRMYQTFSLRNQSKIDSSQNRNQTTRNNQRRKLKFRQTHNKFDSENSVLNQQDSLNYEDKKVEKMDLLMLDQIKLPKKQQKLFTLSLKKILLKNFQQEQ